MEGIHKRAAAAHPVGVNGGTSSTSNGNGQHTSVPLATQQRRRKRRGKKGSHILDDWMVVILGCLVLVGCAYWVSAKIWMELTGSASDDDHVIKAGKQHRHRKEKSPMEKLKPAPFNEVYHLPESHAYVGDRSDRYAKMRQHYDEMLPKDLERSMQAVRTIREAQDANDYNVVPIVASESHGSLHHGGGRPRRHHHNGAPKERDMEEEKEDNAAAEEEAKLKSKEVYDIYDCPDKPVDGYPYAWPILTLLDNWSPDDTTIPEVIYQGLCVFDYQKDFDKAMRYRNLELPFIMQNDPEVARTVERWNTPQFIPDLLKGVKHRCEYSPNNHFMYHLPAKPGKKKGRMYNKTPKDYKPPTDMLRMTYLEWLKHANVTTPKHDKNEEKKEGEDEDDVVGPEHEHWYFRLIGCGLTGQDGSCDKGSSEYLFDELPFFQPVDNLYLRVGEQQKGIHCRFGMKVRVLDCLMRVIWMSKVSFCPVQILLKILC